MDDKKNVPVTNKASLAEKSLGDSLVNWAVNEYVIPKVKDMCHDLVAGVCDMLSSAFLGAVDKTFYGEDYRPNNGTNRNYSSYYKSSAPTSTPVNTSNSVYDRFVQVEDRMEADKIRAGMIELIDNYTKARVGDLLELAGMPTRTIDWDYGWTSSNVINYTKRGRYYVFNLPRPIKLTK